MILPPLNCSGCRTCCLGDTVTLMPGDDPARYKTKLVGRERQLAKGKDGNCVYLGPKGCKIHSRAPKMCKALDCRKYALMFEAWPQDKQESRMASPQNRGTIEVGLRKLGEIRGGIGIQSASARNIHLTARAP